MRRGVATLLLASLGYQPLHTGRKSLVTLLYPRCTDVRNVDMTNQITVWFCAYILPRKHNVRANFVFCERNLVSSPTPPSGWSEKERSRVWEITQGRGVLKECCGQTTNGLSRFRRAHMSTRECNTTRPAN